MSNDIRERAKQILSVVPPLGKQINSVGATADLFTKLTGKTQAQLQSNWDGGGIMTTPNVTTVRWSASGTVEKFVKAPVVIEQMGGTWNDKEPLTAVKM
jgi:hypothetical protein